MIDTPSQILVAELVSQGIRLTPDEALAIGCEICRHLARHRRDDGVVFLPRFEDIRLDASGSVLPGDSEPLSEDEAVRRVVELLERILPPVGCDVRVPAPVRYALARARADLDVPPYRTVDELARALSRFQVCDSVAAVRTLVARSHGQAGNPRPAPVVGDTDPELTVSDRRRWRRAASRVSLQQIAYRVGIPHSLLRELEWGYFENWPSAPFAETYLRAYAREAGIDPEVVLRVVMPQLPTDDRPATTAFAQRVRPGWTPVFRYAAAAAGLLLAVIGILVWSLWVGDSRPADGSLPKPAIHTERASPPARLAVKTQDPSPSATTLTGAKPDDGASLSRVRGSKVRRAPPRNTRGWVRELGRLLAGDGRHKVTPVPRPTAAGG